jgi:hypothetical protein
VRAAPRHRCTEHLREWRCLRHDDAGKTGDIEVIGIEQQMRSADRDGRQLVGIGEVALGPRPRHDIDITCRGNDLCERVTVDVWRIRELQEDAIAGILVDMCVQRCDGLLSARVLREHERLRGDARVGTRAELSAHVRHLAVIAGKRHDQQCRRSAGELRDVVRALRELRCTLCGERCAVENDGATSAGQDRLRG